MIEKIESYIEAVIMLSSFICFCVGVDYGKLNNTKDILIYCFIMSNGVLGCVYVIHKFVKTIFKKKE